MQPVYSDTFLVPLPHTAISHFNVDTIFSVNVLSVGSSNNTDQSHTYRMLTVCRHCTGHHCPLRFRKTQFPAACQYRPLGASVSNSVFHKVISSHLVLKKITDRWPNFASFLLSSLQATCFRLFFHLSVRVIMLHQPLELFWVISIVTN